ncbi:RICIN domain-containing protein [Micromonospora sp. NPDC050795]|uniref:RICIN domain-containing protein n=1 Tax=Micromonospora sp. NPDC050795 TaxID=3364282 RepID=UPI0037A8AF57
MLAVLAAGIGWSVASADSDKLTGIDIPDRYLPAIETAARSCPMLTPARVAGQLMAESGLKTAASDTESGGRGIAGLDDGDWRKWAPWPSAERANTGANILALAHQVCDFSGQLRLAKVAGDPWMLSLAAFRSDLPTVLKAGGVPESAVGYVKEVTGYAAYYARQPDFGSVEFNPARTTPGPGKPLSDAYLRPVLEAGSVCSQFSPAAVAAVLMAVSAFNPNLLGSGGEQGIAQFRPELWQRYGPPDASAWDPSAAVPAIGSALCGLLTELSGLEGDPYALALAAFHIGPDAVRQSGGTFDSPTQVFLTEVESYTAYYRLDTRLTKVATPAPTTPTTAPPSSVPAPVVTTAPPKPSATKSRPGTPVTTTPVRRNQPRILAGGTRSTYGPYFIYNHATEMCVDIPGAGPGTHAGPINQYGCAKRPTDNQEFAFVPAAVDSSGHQLYWIRNVDDSFCLDPPGTTTVKVGTQLIENKCHDNDNQYFRLEPRFISDGYQYYWLRNTVTGYCLNLPGAANAPPGTRLALSTCVANDDHDWALIHDSEW